MAVTARDLALLACVVCGCGGTSHGAGTADASTPSDGGTGADGSGPADDACAPLVGCSSTTECPAADGCNTCECLHGAWACTGYACVADAGTSNTNCFAGLAYPGPICAYPGETCDKPLPPGYQCSWLFCQCDPGLVAQCQYIDCGDAGESLSVDAGFVGVCPDEEPAPSSSCPSDYLECGYGTCPARPGTFGTACFCTHGAWSCAVLPDCGDGGGSP